MKRIALGLVIFAIIVAFIFAFSKLSHKPTPSITSTKSNSTPTTTSGQTQLCKATQIKATITSEGAAGSIYGKLTMKNTSDKSCLIFLGNTIKASFNATNITAKYQQYPTTNDFVLEPKATVYSQVRFPNGPQCQSGINPKEISFSYIDIPFNTANKTQLMIQSCTSSSEQTVVDIWPVSKTPITQ